MKSTLRQIIFAVFALFILQVSLIADSRAQEPAAEEELLVMNMPDLDIRSLIQWAVDSLDKNIVVHRSVQGNVTILADTPLTRDQAWQVFLTAMQINGFVVVETGEVTRIIPEAGAIETNIPLVASAADADSAEMIIKLIPVENISTAELISILRPLVPQVGLLSSFEQGNTLIIADYANNLSRIEAIIENIDQPSTIDVEIIPLTNANATQVISILNSLTPAAAADTAPGSQVTFAVDERTNSILLGGNANKRQQMRGIIANLDRPIAVSDNTNVIYINYLDATELAPIVRAVMESAQTGQRSEATTAVPVSLEASTAPNALILTGPDEIIELARSVIASLDIRRAQVLVEAIIVEVNQDQVDELGVLWSTSGENIGGDGVVAISQNIGGSLRDALSTENGNLNMNLLGTGFTLGYYREGTLRAMLRALQTDTAANVLSTPSIVTLDNEEAEIIVGANVPFLTGSRETQGSNSLFNTIERRDIGITLKIKPQINNGDSITLEINQTAESVTDRAQAADIQTDKREISTKVIIYDEDILVLGGLIKDGLVDSESKVPILGDLPIAGRLFRSSKSTTEKKNLMVFIHASILKDQLEENAASRERYNGIRNQQLIFAEETDELGPFDNNDSPLLPEFETYRPNMAPLPVEN